MRWELVGHAMWYISCYLYENVPGPLSQCPPCPLPKLVLFNRPIHLNLFSGEPKTVIGKETLGLLANNWSASTSQKLVSQT